MLDRTRRLLLAGFITVPTAAFMFGGWAVLTVEDVPEYAVAGKPFELTYTLRQHGMGLLEGMHGMVKVDRRFAATATPLGLGRYRASVTIAEPGTHELKIDDGFTALGGHMAPVKVIAANAPVPSPLSGYERGHQLYLAKGCASCHSHQLTKDIWTSKTGPDLSEPKFAAAYLSKYLADPSVKTDWKTDARMPNLALRPAEITALIAFLNQEKRTASR